MSERSTAGTFELDLGAMGAPGESAAGAVDALLSRDPAVRELRETFARLAPVPPVPLVARDAPRRVERAEAADRRSRRRTAAVAACLTLAAVATLSGVARERAQAEAARLRDERQRAAYAALHPTVLNGDLSVWPTRGSHAEDGPFLASVRASVGAPAALLFAGDVLGLDVAIAVTGSGSDQLLHVHVLSRGPESSQGIWQETGAAAVYPPEAPVVSAVVPDGQGRSHLLVLTLTSGVGVAYSPAPVLKDDATVSRRYVRLPLADGVGIALVDAPPDRLRLRVESAHLEAVETPLVADPSPGATRVPPLGTSVSRAPSCAASPQADVLSLVDDAARHAGLSVAEITSVRFPWCRRAGASGEAAIWMSGARGPDIQCYENVQEATDGLRSSASMCWPVPRGSGPTAPFLAPDLSPSGEPAKDLTLTVSAPGASTAYLRVGPPGSPAIARTSIARDGYGHLVVPATRGQPLSVVEGEGVVVLLGPRGEAMSFLLVSARTQTPSEAWGDGLDGPVEQASAPPAPPARLAKTGGSAAVRQ